MYGHTFVRLYLDWQVGTFLFWKLLFIKIKEILWL